MTPDTTLPTATQELAFQPAPEILRAAPARKRAAKSTSKKNAEANGDSPPEAKPKPARKTAAKKSAKATADASVAPAQVSPAPEPAPAIITEPAVQVPPAPVQESSSPTPHSSAEQAPSTTPQAEAAPQPQDRPHQTEGRPQQEWQRHGGQRFRKWDKRNRFRDRDRNRVGQQEGDAPHPFQPPPERPLGPPEPTEGILELTPKGYGFLRQKSRLFAQNPQDPWVSPELIRNIGLREGMFIKGIERMGNRGPQVTEIREVNGLEPDKVRDLPLFEELKAVNPNKRILLETRPDRLTTRVIDMMTPVGRGQRGLIVAPPRAGKTTLIEHIAEAVQQNHPQMHVMLLLVDERPEEVTEFRRVLPNAEIHASSNDSDPNLHLRTAVFAIERAKRLVESGHHVFMLLDSITRMGRAFNNAHKSGATMSGGVGVGALELPRRLFAAARNTRDAGSLTILATALIETGSRMDELIFQEFKGTGNFELVLDRKIAEQYIYPAVNIFRSGTRREELLLPPFQLEKIHMLRRGLAGHKPIDAIQRVIQLMERSPTNTQMLVDLPGKTASSMG